jgi:hypothetical protein
MLNDLGETQKARCVITEALNAHKLSAIKLSDQAYNALRFLTTIKDKDIPIYVPIGVLLACDVMISVSMFQKEDISNNTHFNSNSFNNELSLVVEWLGKMRREAEGEKILKQVEHGSNS